MTDALCIENLSVAYGGPDGDNPVLSGVSLRVARGECLGLVGESGCGKSTIAWAALGALPRGGRITEGSVRIDGVAVDTLPPSGLRALWARRVSMVYQDPSRALNPTLTIGFQVMESFAVLGTPRVARRARALDMLARVRIADPARILRAYPHELSGGMQQRVVIAMALAKDPALLILDEPTTGLDATVEAEVLDLVQTLRRESGTAVLLISHNLPVVARMADRIGVLYAGTLVEEGPASSILSAPRHPYTARLLRCLPEAGRTKQHGALQTIPGQLPQPGLERPACVFAPRCDLVMERCRIVPPPAQGSGNHTAWCHLTPPFPVATLEHRLSPDVVSGGDAVLRAIGLCKTYEAAGRRVQALSDVSFALAAGETLGLVGESGSGKSTLAKLLLGLAVPDTGGRIELDRQPLAGSLTARKRADRKALQIIFQNPDSALNRAQSVRHILSRPLARLAGLSGGALQVALAALLDGVRLGDASLGKRPRALSGGMKQRVAIARAFAGNPRVVICDEPTSALDVSVQAAILNLLVDLQRRRGVSTVFISHDLGVVRYLADRIAVLYLGRIVEIGPAEAVFAGPHHPYTEALLSAAAGTEGARVRLTGEIPSAAALPQGCVFHTRCPRKLGVICETEAPVLPEGQAHAISCHLFGPDRGTPKRMDYEPVLPSPGRLRT